MQSSYTSSSNYPIAGFSSQGVGNYGPNQEHQQQQFGGANDANSVERFTRESLPMVQQTVAELQSLARKASSGIQNAYHLGSSPAQVDADLNALKQTLFLLLEQMRDTGVGGLPLLPVPVEGATPFVPTEDQLLTQIPRALHILYEKLKRNQDSAAVVANLLSLPPDTRQANVNAARPS